jgi:hypothetical protein
MRRHALRSLSRRATASAILASSLACSVDIARPLPAELPDAASADAGADAASVDADEPAPFVDDFERPEGPVADARWRDTGRGTPEVWAGALCMHSLEEAAPRLEPHPYRFIRLEVLADPHFELHLEGEAEDLLAIHWLTDRTLGTASGVNLSEPLAAPNLVELRIALDYGRQLARIELGEQPAVEVPFESRAPVAALRTLRFFNHAEREFAWDWGVYELAVRNTACVDNLLIAPEEPAEDPLAAAPPPSSCLPSVHEGSVEDCVARHCCELRWTCVREGSCENHDACVSNCVHHGPTGELEGCGEEACMWSDSAVLFAECVDRHCSREAREEAP